MFCATYHDNLQPLAHFSFAFSSIVSLFLQATHFLPQSLHIGLGLFACNLRSSQLQFVSLPPLVILCVAIANIQMLEALNQALDVAVGAAVFAVEHAHLWQRGRGRQHVVDALRGEGLQWFRGELEG